jgi:hypothetical protein
MPDDVGSNYPDIAALVNELLDQMHEADQMLGTDPHAAVKRALEATLRSIMKFSVHKAPDGVPRVVPGAALARLIAAHDDLERGIVDPVLQPKPEARRKGNYLPLMTELLRVAPAAAMQLLINAGRNNEPAAREVVRMMGENHPMFADLDGERWRIVARWRTEILSGDDPDTKQKFDDYLQFVTNFLRDKEGTADDLVGMARLMLREVDRYG